MLQAAGHRPQTRDTNGNSLFNRDVRAVTLRGKAVARENQRFGAASVRDLIGVDELAVWTIRVRFFDG